MNGWKISDPQQGKYARNGVTKGSCQGEMETHAKRQTHLKDLEIWLIKNLKALFVKSIINNPNVLRQRACLGSLTAFVGGNVLSHGDLWQTGVKISSRSCPVTGIITVEAPYTHSYFLSFLWMYLFHIFPKLHVHVYASVHPHMAYTLISAYWG